MRGDMAMFKMERKNFSEGKTNRKKKIICISAVILIALFAGIIFLVSNGIKLYQNKIANAENIQALSTKTPLTATNKITGQVLVMYGILLKHLMVDMLQLQVIQVNVMLMEMEK